MLIQTFLKEYSNQPLSYGVEKEAMDLLTNSLPEDIHRKLTDSLAENLYSTDVFDDEIQAYMTQTHIQDVYSMTNIPKPKLKKYMDQYKTIYEKFYEQES